MGDKGRRRRVARPVQARRADRVAQAIQARESDRPARTFRSGEGRDDRRQARRLLGFLAAVFIVKLLVVAGLHDHPLLQPDSGLDTSAYVALAARVRSGDLLLGPGLYFVSPLYVYFLAAALTLLRSFTAVRVLQVALGTAAVGLIFAAAREWFGRRAAWMAAVAAALTGLFTFYEALLLQSALDPFLTAAALAALARACRDDVAADLGVRPAADRRIRRTPAAGWFLMAGIVFGIQILNRPNVIVPAAVLIVLLAAWDTRTWMRHAAARRGGHISRRSLAFAAGLALALAPMLARNVAVARVWSPLPSHGGLNFYIGNNPDADGTYHSVPGITPNIAGQEADTRRVASHALGHEASDAEASSYFTGRAIEWLRAHPADALRLFGRKLAYTLNAAHIPLNDSYPFYAYDMRTLLALLFVGAWVLVPLGLTGLVVCARRDRLGPYLIWVSFLPAYAISVAIFFAADRYRVPLLVPLCVGTGAIVDFVIATVLTMRNQVRDPRDEDREGPRERRPPIWAVTMVAGLFVFANWPLHLDDGRIEERTRMAEQLASEGRTDEADRWAAKAEAESPQPALVQFRVGRALLTARRTDAAVRHLERARQLDPGRAETDYALGEALLDAGRASEAVPHLRMAVAAGVRPDVAGFDLARALAATGDRSGAIDALGDVSPANARDAASWLALGDLAVQLQSTSLEERFFAGAVSADPANATAQLNLAVAYAQQGNVEQARAHAEQALRRKPDYEKARQFLAALGRPQ